jgi:hypothetical protein
VQDGRKYNSILYKISSGLIWTRILIIIGVKQNQEMTPGRAVLVLVVPLVFSFTFRHLFSR